MSLKMPDVFIKNIARLLKINLDPEKKKYKQAVKNLLKEYIINEQPTLLLNVYLIVPVLYNAQTIETLWLCTCSRKLVSMIQLDMCECDKIGMHTSFEEVKDYDFFPDGTKIAIMLNKE